MANGYLHSCMYYLTKYVTDKYPNGYKIKDEVEPLIQALVLSLEDEAKDFSPSLCREVFEETSS